MTELSGYSVYAILNINAVVNNPAERCLQWSSDGQLFFMTKSSVYVFTPQLGVNFDLDAIVKSATGKDVIRWFRTAIELDKVSLTKWADLSADLPTLSLGSLDLSLLAVAISPSGSSANGGCTAAILTSNLDVHLFAAERNFLKGQWTHRLDLTSFLLMRNAGADGEFSDHAILQSQVTSITWTPLIPFATEPAPYLDTSVLILGNRAGYITILRYFDDLEPEILGTISVSCYWITHLAFDGWNLQKAGHREEYTQDPDTSGSRFELDEGFLAYGASDGSVGLIKITQVVQPSEGTFPAPQPKPAVSMEQAQRLIYRSDESIGLTSLQWVHFPGRSSILVSSAPGHIKLFSASNTPSSTFWTGHRVLRLGTQKVCKDSSSLHPVSGVSYLPKMDRLIVTLYDGSFHVVENLSRDPCYADTSSITTGDGSSNIDAPGVLPTSQYLSNVARLAFEQSHKERVDSLDCARIYGSASYDQGPTIVWAYEAERPSDFSYKQDSKRNSMIVVTRLWASEDDHTILEDLASLLKSVKASPRISPLHILRPYFLHLQETERLERLHPQLLDVLRTSDVEDFSKTISLRRLDEEDLQTGVRQNLRLSLATHLFGFNQLLALRMKLSIADFIWKTTNNQAHRAECGIVAQAILQSISGHTLRILLRHVLAVSELITAQEIPFAAHLVIQTQTPGCSADLIEEGQQLASRLLTCGNSLTTTSNPFLLSTALNEPCLACGTEIPFGNVSSAQCLNKHTWARCSITGLVLSTPWVRTCVGCSRKAFIPPSRLSKELGQTLPNVAGSWVVVELLEAINRCLFCSNGFVTVL